MKNLMILACVLVLAPAASGMLIFSTPDDLGGNTVMENTSITIEVTGDVATTSFDLNVDMGGVYSTLAVGTYNAGFSSGSVGAVVVNPVEIQGVAGDIGGGSTIAAGQVLYDFTLTAGAKNNTITIDSFAGMSGGPPLYTTHNGGDVVASTLTLNIVPEPATIVLLGLGGLLLRRRR